MPPMPATRKSTSDTGAEPSSAEETCTPTRIDPEKVRVVDIEEKETGELISRDCYDPDGGAAEMGDVMKLRDGELWLRTIDWARSKSHSEELTLRWEPTGLTQEDVGRIGVFTWPMGEPVRIFSKKDRK